MQAERNKPIRNCDLQSRVVSVLYFDNTPRYVLTTSHCLDPTVAVGL